MCIHRKGADLGDAALDGSDRSAVEDVVVGRADDVFDSDVDCKVDKT